MNGIQGIGLKNITYGISTKTRDPVGIVIDFDIATWIGRSTTNNDRVGTIPLMAIDRLDPFIPRLYRHDMEFFNWVLAYISIARIVYKKRTIKISPLPGFELWLQDDDSSDRRAHIVSKIVLQMNYGRGVSVSACYYRYFIGSLSTGPTCSCLRCLRGGPGYLPWSEENRFLVGQKLMIRSAR